LYLITSYQTCPVFGALATILYWTETISGLLLSVAGFSKRRRLSPCLDAPGFACGKARLAAFWKLFLPATITEFTRPTLRPHPT